MFNVKLENFEGPLDLLLYFIKRDKIDIYDISGRLVKVLVNDIKHRGIHSVVWDGTDHTGVSVSNGMYIYKLTSDQNNSLSNKIIFVK